MPPVGDGVVLSSAHGVVGVYHWNGVEIADKNVDCVVLAAENYETEWDVRCHKEYYIFQ